MAMNDLTVNQISTVLNAVYKQATGQTALAPASTADFVAQAQTVLKTGYDNAINAISQVLSRTIFSVRPYNAKFDTIRVSEQRYGNHVRKINYADKDFENDDRLPLTDGASVDMYKINKPDVVQTNWYGETVFQKSITRFRDQLDVAFSNAEEFGQFIAGMMQNVSDQIEQAHETLARGTVANYIGAAYDLATAETPVLAERVVHLLTEYNSATGLSLTATTVRQPDNFAPFIRWMYARINQISSMLTERSAKYHLTLDKALMRHTPYARQRMLLYAGEMFNIASSVLSDTFNADFLKLAKYETVNYWQNIANPQSIDVSYSTAAADGTVATGTASVDNIVGVLFDEEALGYTVVNQWVQPTPFNARGGYTNIFWHFTDRYWNDASENFVLFLLD